MKKDKNLKSLLGIGGFWVMNKKLANKLGMEATLVFQHLLDLNTSFFKEGQFYQQLSRMEKDLPLSKRQISNSIKKLASVGFIKVTRGELFNKNHYLIMEDAVISFMMQDDDICTTSDVNFTTLKNA